MSESVFADRIVQNLLDTDFYKLTMMQAVLHNYPNVEVEWEFRCRNSEDLRPYLAEIRYQIERLAELSLSPDQLGFLERISFMKPDFLRFLGLFRFNLRYVQTGIENGELFIRLRGPWLHVILFEVPMYRIDMGKEIFYALDEAERDGILDRLVAEKKRGKPQVTRFKGLGEMNPPQLRETTMDPNTRRLVQLTLEDFAGTSEMMDMLLAKKRAPDRKAWLESKGNLAEVLG